jgi:cyclopropane-fatty-acyl-phospholipid synthase
LSEAQIAAVDLNLDKLDLKPGMTLLEVGCGWGLTLQRAMEKYDVNVIGLTLSNNQQAYCQQLLEKLDSDRTFDVRLEGWEQFHSPVDRIVSIEAIEHFGFERYDDFFKNCFDILPEDGRMTVQSSVGYHPLDMAARGKKLTFDLARFIKFMLTEIFPGGRIPTTQMMVEHGEKAGFVVPETVSLRNHYIKTLGLWADALERNKEAAIAATDEENYHRYMRYLKGCQYYFIDETIDVSLVTYLKPGAVAA